jgi:hypothetical protein
MPTVGARIGSRWHDRSVLLVVFAMGPILLLWLSMSRISRTRWPVALFLAGLTALAAMLSHFLPRGMWEISLACLAVAVLAVAAARLCERRRLGPGGQIGVVVSMRLFAGWVVLVLCSARFSGDQGRSSRRPTRCCRCRTACTPRSSRTTTAIAAQDRAHGRSRLRAAPVNPAKTSMRR